MKTAGRALLLAAATALAACTSNVALRDTRSGAVIACKGTVLGLNPWSQQDACNSRALAQGWVTTDASGGAAMF